jgi:ATP-binding cassette subfamily B protein
MMDVMKLISWIFPLTQLLTMLATLIVIGVGGYDVIGGHLSLGELVAFNSYVGLLILPLFSLGGIVFQVAAASAAAKRISDVLDISPDVESRPGAVALAPASGQVSFEHVAFCYPGAHAPTLQDVSCDIETGLLVAIVGPTGSGKSTFIHLIPRFYDVTEGRIAIGGRDIRELTLESLRSQVGIALQSTRLMRGTIRENIAFGRPAAPPCEVEEAARMAQAHDFIAALPRGYETALGEVGAGLSGGQQQRIALARALLLRPPILLLDDSTSALDASTEMQFFEALRALPYPCTRLVVTERLTTVQLADEVLFFEAGRLVERGTHQALMLRGSYAALFRPRPAAAPALA